MSIVQEILYIVSNYPGGYKLLYNILYDSQPPSSRINNKRLENTLRITLKRLKRKGLLKNTKGEWAISTEGKEFLNSGRGNIKRFFPLAKSSKKQKELIITFDVPEKKRKYRDWLRSELIGFGFDPVQKSVWFGPALPKEFMEYLDQEKILKYIRFFRVSEDDLI